MVSWFGELLTETYNDKPDEPITSNPFDNKDDVFTPNGLHLPSLIKRFQDYLHKNREWLLKDAPRRKDLRIYEAVYHFNLFMFLQQFLKIRKGKVYPEFPTGNGKIGLVIQFQKQTYGLELKSFSDTFAYQEALEQAAKYGKQLSLNLPINGH